MTEPSSWRNFSKMTFWSSAEMPGPVSEIAMRMAAGPMMRAGVVDVFSGGVVGWGSGGGFLVAGGDGDAAIGGGEFDGVGEEVVEDLLEAAGIGGDEGHGGGDEEVEFDIFFLGEGTHEIGHGFADVGDVDLFFAEDEFSGFDFGEIEEVIDEIEELFGAGADVFGVALLFRVAGVFSGVGGEVGEADDGVEGGAEFVGDVGEEFGFEAIGFEEIDVRLGEFTDAGVEGAVGGFELVLRALKGSEHGVEGFGEVLEFIAGGDGGADFEISGGDFFGSVFEDADGLKD